MTCGLIYILLLVGVAAKIVLCGYVPEEHRVNFFVINKRGKSHLTTDLALFFYDRMFANVLSISYNQTDECKELYPIFALHNLAFESEPEVYTTLLSDLNLHIAKFYTLKEVFGSAVKHQGECDANVPVIRLLDEDFKHRYYALNPTVNVRHEMQQVQEILSRLEARKRILESRRNNRPFRKRIKRAHDWEELLRQHQELKKRYQILFYGWSPIYNKPQW